MDLFTDSFKISSSFDFPNAFRMFFPQIRQVANMGFNQFYLSLSVRFIIYGEAFKLFDLLPVD
ncbi:hypothetical protein NUKP23_43640 [Klebsiella variicola]|nr:hypothetical protein NUKP23_43640 [Klebsiella variicola]